jgi:Icc-related predicted phosphoesterase
MTRLTPVSAPSISAFQCFHSATSPIDESVTIEGRVFYGSPYQPWYHGWAFNFPEEPDGLKEAAAKWSAIPRDTSVLVTHTPAYGLLDQLRRGVHAGCPALRTRLESLTKLRLHVFGHIHEAYGSEVHDEVLRVNASICNADYEATRAPIVCDLPGHP